MELNDTVDLMTSEDYKDRFKAEYHQTKNRFDKLHAINIKIEAGTIDFEPKTPTHILREQERAMDQYLRALELRAQYESIEL